MIVSFNTYVMFPIKPSITPAVHRVMREQREKVNNTLFVSGPSMIMIQPPLLYWIEIIGNLYISAEKV